MAIQRDPKFEPPVKQLRELADAEFTPSEFKIACERFSRLDKENTDDDLLQFDLQDGADAQLVASLFLNPAPAAIICAILAFCWWETFTKDAHKSYKAFRDEQEEFDRIFDDELERATKIIGAPVRQGADKKAPAHKHAIWQGKNALLILQQSANDVQFGYDVNYWIQPYKSEELAPSSPLINWLHMLNQIPPGIQLPPTWEPCLGGFEAELKRELAMNFFHRLRNVQATAVARSNKCDDVLFELRGHKKRLAQVHLTWSREMHPHWPHSMFFDSWEQWAEFARKEFDEEQAGEVE
jgi:hypothetical protein